MSVLRTIVVLSTALLFARSGYSQENLSSQAFRVLRQHCNSCHSDVNPQADLAILEHDSLIGTYVTPGKPDKSELWARISSDDDDDRMPPPPTPSLSQEERDIVRKWILAGAKPFPPVTLAGREIVTVKAEYLAIQRDLASLPDVNRTDIRYFTISHLHNNPKIVQQDLALFRAALSKMINSLTWQAQIIRPRAINREKTVFRVNLAELGWDKNKAWELILGDETQNEATAYPYGLVWSKSQDAELASASKWVYDQTRTIIPIVRADWFVARVGVGELYYDILDMPQTASELETSLKVDIERDFQKNLLRRAGFSKSNVSEHNRVVDRHWSIYGAYWRSWDFANSLNERNILLNPLGSNFVGNSFNDRAFSANGGEIIFHLPNGLQGYMLVDDQGGRIVEGPIEIVKDSRSPLGNQKVINAISCISCHGKGMQPFRDAMRAGHGLTERDAIQKLELLVPAENEMNKLVERDTAQFRRALEETIGPDLDGRDVFEVVEPVSAIARQFSRKIDATDVAAEIGFQGPPEKLQAFFKSKQAAQVGLKTLGAGGVIDRRLWETKAAKKRTKNPAIENPYRISVIELIDPNAIPVHP